MFLFARKNWVCDPGYIRFAIIFAALVSAGAMLSACTTTGVVAGAAATTGIAVAQERTVGDAVDDTTTQVNIKALLLKEDERLFRKVGVEVLEGRVLLTGAVPTPDDRVRATMVAWKSGGVREVINELQVTDKTSLVNYAKDSWITTQLRTKMLTDSEIFDINYSVETVNGAVYLLGIARNQPELDRVTNYARNIAGVTKVVSHVRIKGASSAVDAS